MDGIQKVIPVLSEKDLTRLLSTCDGRDFESRRDLALLRFYITTGPRSFEGAGLRHSGNDPSTNDINFDTGRAKLHGPGGRERWVALDRQTLRAIDDYLSLRTEHEKAGLPWLWLSKRGRLTIKGIRKVLDRRADEAALPHLHLRDLRHTSAHYYLGLEMPGWE